LAVGVFEGVDDVFDDPVFGGDGHGAESGPCGFSGTAVVHGDTEESGVTEGFDVRAGFFEVSAEGFFAGVDAGDDLEFWFGWFEVRLSGADMDGIEGLVEEPAFEGEVEDASAFEVIEGVDFGVEMLPLSGGELEELAQSPVVELCELEDDEGVVLFATGVCGFEVSLLELLGGFGNRAELGELLTDNFGGCEFIEDESDGEELEERAVRGRAEHSIGPCFGLPDHSGPAAECEE
jgi:hypothetical protein